MAPVRGPGARPRPARAARQWWRRHRRRAFSAACIIGAGVSKASGPRLPRCTRPPPGRALLHGLVVRLKVTGQPAWACSARAAASSTWASERWSRLRLQRTPMAGNSARRRASKPACAHGAARALQARWPRWRWRLQRLGPRKARMRVISMGFSFSANVGGIEAWAQPGIQRS
jgi:hypothetical protein